MKRKIFSLLLMLNALLFSFGCQHPDGKVEWPDETQTQWLTYNETQCADPWGYGNSQQDKAQYLKEYLEKQGVTVLYISLTKVNDGAMCMACICGSGRVYKVQVKKGDEAKLLTMGFKLM